MRKLTKEHIDPEQLILEWKERYGYIYVAELNDIRFVFRLIPFKAYNEAVDKMEDLLELEEWVCKEAVLDPQVDWTDDIYAGFTKSLAETILEESLLVNRTDGGMNATELIEQEELKVSQSLLTQMPLIIKHCFQEYSLNDIQNMALPQQISLYAKAKWMLENLQGVTLSLEKEQ